jgi:DNA-binding MarR family transcriptional regulator
VTWPAAPDTDDEIAAGLPSSSESAAAPPSTDAIADLGDMLSRFIRTVGRARSQYLTAAKHNVDWSAQVLIAQLVREGPVRVGTLADCVQSDASTVSRQVAAMVQDGLVERRADPVDGRASVLVATEKALAIYADHNRLRDEYLARMLRDWNDDDCRQFATLMARFAKDAFRPQFLASAAHQQPEPAGPVPAEQREES